MKAHLIAVICLLLAVPAIAHPDHIGPPAEATYIANAGVLISHGDNKIMFDPLFTEGFNNYQVAPDEIRVALFAGTPPYDDVDAIFISHAHGDHFSPTDAITYLSQHPKTRLIGSAQMADMMTPLAGYAEIESRVTGIALDYNAPAATVSVGDIHAEAVRIPHAGGEGRRDIQNYVWRVSLTADNTSPDVTIMHMGDADPADKWFAPHEAHWQARQTGTAFPPYWFYASQAGHAILSTRLNALSFFGVHVPVTMPPGLAQSGLPIFHTPGESRILPHSEHTGPQ